MNITKTSNFKIESLGVHEIDVYDIEVEKHHNFFANDILVHNSIYICIDNIMKDFEVPMSEKVDVANEICNKIEKNCIQKTFDNIFDEFNCFERRLVMKREVIASRGVWTGKKHYILNVYDNEGVRYQEPKLKVVGIESVKSSTPKVCKTAMNDLFKIIMNGSETDAQKFIGDFKNKFIKLKPHEKAFPRSVSKVTQYTDAKTIYSKTETVPINSRASILYNHLCDINGLKCERIKDGNRMYFIYLVKKNPIRENVIGFIDVLPLEFGLDKFVDNDIQFEKAFLQPMRTIFSAIGWDVEEQDSLETFF